MVQCMNDANVSKTKTGVLIDQRGGNQMMRPKRQERIDAIDKAFHENFEGYVGQNWHFAHNLLWNYNPDSKNTGIE